MHTATRWCFYCLHKVWLALALLLVLLAVLITVLRYSLPYADNYKHELEQLISERYGATVRIGELSAGWQKFGPALLLRQVELSSPEQQLQLDIAETRVRLDFWRSLLNRQLTAQHFELHGLRYYLDSNRILAGPTDAELDTAPVIAALEQLLFRQLAYFSLTDSQLIVQQPQQDDVVININQLDWRNKGNRHQGSGELSLAGVTANTVSVVLDLYGDTLADAFGQLYLQSDKLDILPWFASVLPPSQKLQQASVNFQAWGRIDKGLLRRMQVELADNSLSWQQQGEQKQLSLGRGQLLWQPEADGWTLSSSALTLTANSQQWQDLQLQLAYRQGYWLGGLTNVDMQALIPLAELLAEDIAPLQQVLAYQPSGQLQQLQWRIGAGQWQLAGKLAAVSSKAQGDIPGVSGVSGEFLLSNTVSKLSLSGEQGELQWDGLFAAPMPYQQLAATAYLRRQQDGSLQLLMPKLQLTNEDLTLNARLQLDQRLQIVARVTDVNAANAYRYYPQRYMPEATREYLTDAIVGGKLNSATLLWHGAPADFPYREQQGVFQVSAALTEGQFAFAPDWPMLSALDASLWFENAAMQINAHSGMLDSISLSNSVQADITDLFDAQYLNIHIAQPVEASSVTALMLQSPLADNLGKTLAHLGVNGTVAADVDLLIGLRQNEVVASGEAVFTNASLALQAPAVEFTQLSGKLEFTNEKIDARELTLTWRGLPISVDVNGDNSADGYQLALALAGRHNSQTLLEALYAPAATLIAGTTDWQAELALTLADEGMRYQAQLQSDLDATALLLPAPYYKSAASQQPLQLTLTGDETQSAINLELGQALQFNAILLHQAQQLRQAQLSLGKALASQSKEDFSISLNLPELDFLAWFDLIQAQLHASQDSGGGIFPPLASVHGKIAVLQLAPGITLNNAVFDASQGEQDWQLQLNATELASRWQFSKDWQQQGINAQLDYLRLPLAESADASAEAAAVTEKLALTAQRWLLQLPPISVNCADCSLGAYRFGQVSARSQSSNDRWQLTEFNARYKRHQLSASGYWQDDGAAGVSQFNGQLQSNNLGTMLDEFQLTSAVSGSSADIQFALSWPGAPNQYQLADLSGQVNYTLGEGALTEVSDQGSRLFSIFSLDSLLRKLRLDFRDVFAKGFFYNSMSGKLEISQGVAQTSNAVIDGVPGNLQIQGYADLVSKELDYQMAFSPKVTSSLPVIIAWMVNPATGLAALALDEVFQSAEVISKINFTVTGSFDKPVVTEVNRHSTEVPVPVRVAQPEAVIELPAARQPANKPKPPNG